jgi:Domain of unknown function (DUF4417)
MTACPLDCSACPALARCGGTSNLCLLGRCDGCSEHPLLRMEVRRAVVEELSGLDLRWPRPVTHHAVGDLPLHLPVMIQAYADPVDRPWIALHAGRVLGVAGRGVTPKHHRPLHEVYRLAPGTRIALQFYVDDRVLAGLWENRRVVIEQLRQLAFDLVLAPNVSVWRDESRFHQLVAERRAFVLYHELLEAGLPAIPDVGFSRFEPDGRCWAEWMNSQADLHAVSIFCGGQKVHAERRAHRETVEDIALLHRAARPDIAFVLGGVHAAGRLADYRQAAPGRRLSICNGMAYALAQRRRLLGGATAGVARSARECFLHNCAHNDRMYTRVLGEAA